jgi:hypothetical protein
VFDIVLEIQSGRLYKTAKENTGIWNGQFAEGHSSLLTEKANVLKLKLLCAAISAELLNSAEVFLKARDRALQWVQL